MKQYHWLGLMFFVVISFCTTFPAFMQVLQQLQSGETSYGYLGTYLFTENASLYFAVSILGVTTGISLFKYLNVKSEVDFFHSLPIKTEHMFLRRYFLGMVYFFVPLCINIIVTYMIASFGVFSGLPDVWTVIEATCKLSAYYFSIYSFVVLGTVVTGNNFMAVCTAVGFSQALTAIVGVFLLLREMFLKFAPYNWDVFENVVIFTNPLGAMVFLTAEEYSTWHLLLQTVVLFGLSFYFYMKRPSENSSNPVAIESFKLIIKSLGVICASALGGLMLLLWFDYSLVNFIAGSFVVGVIFHCAFEMLFDQDVKAGLRNKRHFVVLYALVAGTATVISLDLTGYDQRLAPVEDISSITWQGMTIENPENIGYLHNMMANAIALGETSYNQGYFEEYQEDEVTVNSSVEVHLKSGGSYQRVYGYFAFMKAEELKNLMCSQEYLVQSHHYDLTEEDFAEMEKSIHAIPGQAGVYTEGKIYVDYLANTKTLTMAEFQEVYELILAQNHLLTPEFLRENTAVLSITYRDNHWMEQSIPLYHIHEEALAMLQLPEREIELDGPIFMRKGIEITAFSDLDDDFCQVLLDNMILIVNNSRGFDRYYYYNPNIGAYTSDITDVVYVYSNDHGWSGYLPLSLYESLVEQA